MKTILLFLLAFQTQFPQIISNASEKDKTESLVYTKFHGKAEFFISLTYRSFWWSDEKKYRVLISEKGKWKLVTIGSKRRKNGNWSKPKVRERKIDQSKVMQLLAYFDTNSFWKLENDPLNKTSQINEDGSVSKFNVDDGTNYRFEILNGNDFRIIESYEPGFFIGRMKDVSDRKSFLFCLEKFDETVRR